ncbi:MAG TPA: glycosyl transferase [Armatimonadetes bacterium]|nr:glycosyl transferase [Armatimonadota bacterium]
MTDVPLLSVIVPVYNEVATLPTVLDAVRALPVDLELIVIDNVSTDGTRELVASLASEPRTTVYLQPENLGKGSSVRVGLALARGRWTVVQDADLEYRPSDLLGLLARAQECPGAAVFGSRLLATKPDVPWHHALGRDLLNALFRWLYRARLTDVATCYKLVPTAAAQSLVLSALGFDLDYELPARLRQAGVEIVELPVWYDPRTLAEGKKLRWTAGLDALGALLRAARPLGQPPATLMRGMTVELTAPPFAAITATVESLVPGGVRVSFELDSHPARAAVALSDLSIATSSARAPQLQQHHTEHHQAAVE